MSVLKSILNSLPEALRSYRGAMFVRTDSTGFWKGKQFTTWYEFNSSTPVYLRVVMPKPFLLHVRDISVFKGELRFSRIVQGTPSGTWTPAPAPVVRMYMIEASPPGTSVWSAGGTVTGGTPQEYQRITAGTGGSIKVAMSTNKDHSTRGLPAGTYYLSLVPTEATEALIVFEWEELDGVPTG